MLVKNEATKLLNQIAGLNGYSTYSSYNNYGSNNTYLGLASNVVATDGAISTFTEPDASFNYGRVCVGSNCGNSSIRWSEVQYDSTTDEYYITNVDEIHFLEVKGTAWGTMTHFCLSTAQARGETAGIRYVGTITGGLAISSTGQIPIVRPGALKIKVKANTL